VTARRVLSRIFLAGAALAVVLLVLIAANVTQASPWPLRRFREPSLVAYGCLLLALLTAPAPASRAREWLARGRAVLEHPRFFPTAAAVLFALYAASTVTRHLAFQTFSHDFSMIDEALYHSHHGSLMHSPVLGRSFFSEHFAPILLLLVPLHALCTSPWVLVLAQAVALWASGLVLRRILRVEGFPRWIANLGFVVWLNQPVVVRTLEYVAHMESFLPLLVFGAYLAFRRRHSFAYAALVLGALAVKEDSGLYLAGFGLWAILAERRFAEGALTAAAGVAWTAWAMEVAIPHFAGGEGLRFMDRWAHWGDGPLGIAAGFATRPADFVRALLAAAPLRLFLGFLFLPFLSRWAWLMVAAPWIVNATSAGPQQAGLALYYGLPIAAFAALASIQGLKSSAFRRLAAARFAPAFAIALVVLSVAHLAFPRIERERGRILAALEAIPPGEPVQAMACFYPALGYERSKVLLESPPRLTERFVVIRMHSSTWPLSGAEAAAAVRDAVDSGNYQIVADVNGSVVLKRRRDAP
jgi:uncharacterized membrane protein